MAEASSKKFTFSIEALNDILTQTKSIKKKLSPFLAKFQQFQMSEIYKTLDYLHQCMTKPKAELKYKFNSLFVLKVLLDTSNFVLVNWIEVLFLPHLVEIAKFTIGGQNTSKEYFLKQGYTAADDPEVEKFGFNYTLLAIELIQVAAMMKPFKLFECQFLETKSDFVLALQQLKKSGFKPPQKLSMYPKPQVLEGQIAKYEQGLAQIAQNEQFPQIYSEYSNQKLQEYLTKRHDGQQQKYQISIVQVFESGDLYLSSQAIEICKAEISEPQSALTFENALMVFHRLMLSADYEAFYVLNNEDGLHKALIDVVDCDKVERGLKRGEKFFGQFEKDSPRVYGIVLDYLQKWALFAGAFVKDDQNMLNKIVVALSETLNIELPQPTNFQQQKKRFQLNLSLNKQRIKRLSQQIQKSPSQLKQVLNHIKQQSKKVQSSVKESKNKDAIVTSSKVQSSNNMSSNNLSTPAGPSEVSNNNKENPFIQQLKIVQEVCDKFFEDEKGYEKNKVVLEKFLNGFQNEIASVPEEVFNQVYQRALNLQAETQEILKKSAIKQFSKKQQPKPQVSQTSLKPQSQANKSLPQSQISKPVTLQTQTKILSKQVESYTVIQGQGQSFKKSLARVETMKDSKKVEDTPVKRFEIEDSERNWEKTQVEKLGYSNGAERRVGGEEKIINNQRSEVQLGYEKPAITNENLSPAQLGYKEDSAPKVEAVKGVPTQKQVKFGYEEQQRNVSSKNIKEAQNNNNNNGLSYKQPPKKSPKQIQQNLHPSSHGYSNNFSQKQVRRQQPLGYQQSAKSHKSIRKTQGLSQSRKHMQESSIKSNSKVQHFSPESSQFSQSQLKEFQNSNFKKKGYEVQELEVLEEFYEEPVYVNKPKEFKSLTRQNREVSKRRVVEGIATPEKQFLPKSQERLQINQKQLSQHNRSQHSQHIALSNSPKNNNQPLTFIPQLPQSPANLPHSNIQIQPQPQPSQQQLQDLVLDDDFINPPHINPLQQSFHDIGELQSRIKTMISNPNSGQQQSNELSFKNCFETDKYILQRQEDKKTKMYWLESDTTNLVKNILVKKEKSRVSKINVPDILDERNKKYQQQIKIVQEEKNRKIKQLQGKIKHLQKESQFFKQQAANHAQQIRTLKANSDFDKQSVGQNGYLKDVESIALQHKLHSPQRFSYSGVKMFHFDTSNLKETYYFDPKGKLINSKKYKECFKQFTKEKEKKLMLKNKDLLFKDKDIEVGFMSKKENDRLIVTLYITPERDIESLTWNMQSDDGLSVESEPHSFVTYVRTKKQEKILFTIGVNRTSFTLPLVQFTYTANEETHKFTITLPCAFHKFFHIKQSDNDLNQHFKRSQHIIRGQQVPYSKKVLKTLESLKDYFQSMGILNKGQPNEQGEISYGGMALYKQHQFPVRVSVKPNQFLYVQALVEPGDEDKGDRQVVEYYVSTVTHLLMKEIE